MHVSERDILKKCIIKILINNNKEFITIYMDTLFLTSCFFCVLTDEKNPTLGSGPPNE